MVRYISDCVGLFQSTSPQGERPRLKRVLQKIMNFNPRPRKGNDTHRYHSRFFYLISIHVPARGTTHILPCNILDRIISIHVPARGTTANISNIITQNNHTFISSIHSFEYHTAKSSPLPPKPSIFCALFPVRIPRTFHVCFTFALQKQCLICRNPLINPHMLYFCFILISQIIESQTVDLFINNFSQ